MPLWAFAPGKIHTAVSGNIRGCFKAGPPNNTDHLENAARNACGWIYVHRENLALLGR